MSEDRILLIEKRSNGVVYLTLNRPDRRNALSLDLVLELQEAIHPIDIDFDVRCVIIRGAGGCFCSGGDLGPTRGGSATETPPLERRRRMIEYGKLISSIVRCDKPFIAQVDGYALGGGLSLAMACDVIIAAESAKLAPQFTHVGVSPEMGSLFFMPAAMGIYKAKGLWYSGRRLSAQEASDLGLVAQVYPDDEYEAETLKLADHIATLPRITLTTMKRSLSYYYKDLEAVLALDPAQTPQCLSDEEAMTYLKENFAKKK